MKQLGVFLMILSLFINCDLKKKQNLKSTAVEATWQSLFNGKDLDDWIVKINGHKLHDNFKNTFRVEKGILKVSYDGYENFENKFGLLTYKTPFSNYKFRLHYRFIGNQTKGGEAWATKNSGVMIHSQAPESMLVQQAFPLSLEVQLLGGITPNTPRPTGNLCTPATHVSIDEVMVTAHCIPAASETYYGEEWVALEIIVTKENIVHKINGKTVITYTNPTIGGQFLEATSKEIQLKDGQPLTSGYISLQSESHPIEFKNIEILEL
ncbi:MAG: hypothetical protein ACI9JT_002036 [Polaribacter sp.]|jgi:hypothetical protein